MRRHSQRNPTVRQVWSNEAYAIGSKRRMDDGLMWTVTAREDQDEGSEFRYMYRLERV